MKPTRREFLQTSAATGALLGLGALPTRYLTPAWADVDPHAALRELELRDLPWAARKAQKPMKILVLGGTAFLGPAFVEIARSRGHELTLFNRGRTNNHLFPDLEKIHGDRSEGHAALAGRTWDAVLDTSGYIPRVVRDAAETLRDHVDHYVFISTVSVYASYEEPGRNEDAPVARLEDPTVEEVTGETYGGLKALCEEAAEAAMPGRVSNLRPGLIVGPLDRTDRFTYWPVRVSRGGEVLAPGDPATKIQVVDVRDLAAFTLKCMEDRIAGTYNCISPAGMFTMGGLLDTCKRVSESDATFTWASAEFLEEQGVQAWSDMPVWVPPTGEYAGFGQTDCSRAAKAGLKIRPLEQTVRDTLDWWKTMPESVDGPRTELRAGISAEREAEVLAAWHARQSE